MSPAAAWLLEAALPPGEGWLTPAEREKAASFPARSRRADWLLGRAAAKRLVAAAESAIGLAILVVLFREKKSINVENLDTMRG